MIILHILAVLFITVFSTDFVSAFVTPSPSSVSTSTTTTTTIFLRSPPAGCAAAASARRTSLFAARKQPRRGKGKGKKSSSTVEVVYPDPKSMPSILPKLLVFDLDNTLWTPELYQIRQKGTPKAGKEIWLFEGARSIVADLATNPGWTRSEDGGKGKGGGGTGTGTRFALASRTHKVRWAEALLERFEAAPGVTLDTLFPLKQIVTGSKRRHFERLRDETGIPYTDMVFFDDDARLNIVEISQLGVLCCHCPRGMTVDLFRGTLERYEELKKGDKRAWMGITVTIHDVRRKSSSTA